MTGGGAAKCWGSNLYGELGTGVAPPPYGSSTPVAVDLADGVSTLALGYYYHSCALTDAGAVRCWGKNHDCGQLGDGTHTDRPGPVQVAGMDSGALAIALGSDFSCAVVGDGGVRCWGRGGYGNLGDGLSADSDLPVVTVGFGDPIFHDSFEAAPLIR